MAGLTNEIEQFLLDMMERGNQNMIEIGRNDLAQQFECAPSQINYVLTTRFTLNNGYYTESRRGGSGFIRIFRLNREPEDFVRGLMDELDEAELTTDQARQLCKTFLRRELISENEAQLMLLAIDDHALADVDRKNRNRVRARIFRNMLVLLLR